MITRKGFLSIPHFEGPQTLPEQASAYYTMIKNASQEFRDEIHDIYFGKMFYYNYEGTNRVYGNAMGLEATDEQIDYLFKIQEEFGIEISLTMNSVAIPNELLYNGELGREFIAFIKSFYDRGLRSCIMGSEHYMNSGILHKNFPDMRWKATVNHNIRDAQSVLNYIYCGYDTIMLDRSLNRNQEELIEIKKVVDYYNNKYKPKKKIITVLLVTEGCLYTCPFKREHDAFGEKTGVAYWNSFSKQTCDKWRYNKEYTELPRNALEIMSTDKEIFKDLFKLVDVFKYAGRRSSFHPEMGDFANKKAVWLHVHPKRSRFYPQEPKDAVRFSSFKELIDTDKVVPLHLWFIGGLEESETNYDQYKEVLKEEHNMWQTDAGKKLEYTLRTCKSRCWDCHLCEQTFNVPYYDSALQLKQNLPGAGE